MELRQNESRATNWITGNRYLSQSEMENNALLVYSIFFQLGYSFNSIIGMLGNMQQESTINPALWQNLTVGTGGYGLVQWTPSTKYTNWANKNGYALDDGYAQCLWIDTMMIPSGEWIKTSEYPITWEEFKTGSYTIDYTTMAFLKNFERAGDEEIPNRLLYATNWYNYFSTAPDIPIPPIVPTPTQKKKKMPLYMMCRFRR